MVRKLEPPPPLPKIPYPNEGDRIALKRLAWLPVVTDDNYLIWWDYYWHVKDYSGSRSPEWWPVGNYYDKENTKSSTNRTTFLYK